MAVLTGNEYKESLKAFSPEVYIRGKRVEEVVSHPLLKQTINHMSSIADLASDPENKGKFTVQSPLINEPVPRLSTISRRPPKMRLLRQG